MAYGDSPTASTAPEFPGLGAKNEKHCSDANSGARRRLYRLHGFRRCISFWKSDGVALTQANGDHFDRAAHDLDRCSSVTFGVVYRHAGPSNLYANAARGAARRGRAVATTKCHGCSKASSSYVHFTGQIVHADGDSAASRNVEGSTSAARVGRRRYFRRHAGRSDGWSDRRHAGLYQNPRGASPAVSRLS